VNEKDLKTKYLRSKNREFTVFYLQLLTKILITYIDNKCLLHPSAVISVRSNGCIRPEDSYSVS
jgi:hypothetical protein